MKPSRWYPRALQDADEAAQWFAGAGGTALELAFIDALQAAVELLERHPEAGSTRHDVCWTFLKDRCASFPFVVLMTTSSTT